MKTKVTNLFLPCIHVLVAGILSFHIHRVSAQTLAMLHTFTAPGTYGINSDGAGPAGLLVSENTLYGTASAGGASGEGTVFRLNTDGAGFTRLHSFTAMNNGTNSDGGDPRGKVILSENTLYGTAFFYGPYGGGTVFAVETNGANFRVLHSFTGAGDGSGPQARLTLSGTTLYGTTSLGNSFGQGSVFALNTDGTGFTNLYYFTALAPYYTNSDGANPSCELTLSGDTLYGTAYNGGEFGNGTVFSIKTNGTRFTNLHSFTAGVWSFPYLTNADGANPSSKLILFNGTLYGTAPSGGTAGVGTLFAVETDGTGFRTLRSFTGGSDGSAPGGLVISSGGTLFGTASGGGSFGHGTIFALKADGTGFEVLHNFAAGHYDSFGNFINSEGAAPSEVYLLSNSLYGTAYNGGASGFGTVFSLKLPQPQLTLIDVRSDVIVTWPTNATGFTLQSTTNLLSPFWTTASPPPVVINGQNTVTNTISGTQQYYRLSQ